MNAVRGGTVTWRPQPWQDEDWHGGEYLSDSDSEEEDFPDDSTTPLGDYITHGEEGDGVTQREGGLKGPHLLLVQPNICPSTIHPPPPFRPVSPSTVSPSSSSLSLLPLSVLFVPPPSLHCPPQG